MKRLVSILMEKVNSSLEFWMEDLVDKRERTYAKVFLIATHILGFNTLIILLPIYGFVISFHFLFIQFFLQCFCYGILWMALAAMLAPFILKFWGYNLAISFVAVFLDLGCFFCSFDQQIWLILFNNLQCNSFFFSFS